MVQGIALEQDNKLLTDNALRVEDGGCVHPEHTDNAPEKLGVPEKDHGGSQEHTHAQAQRQQTEQSEGKQQQRGTDGGT